MRYWIGFCVIIQGAIASAVIAWLLGKFLKRRTPPVNPPNRVALLLALIWLAAFWAGQASGLGLAQPWFDPLGYFGRILAGDAREVAYGLTQTGGWTRGFSGGFSGTFWIILNTLDSLIMYIFLFRLPWPDVARQPAATAGPEGEHT
jgi:hypothetical protein